MPDHVGRLPDPRRAVVGVPVEAPAVDLLATGSEVGLAVAAAHALEAEGVSARVISAPWREQLARSRQHLGRPPSR